MINKIDQIWVYIIYSHPVHKEQRIFFFFVCQCDICKSLPYARSQRKPKNSKSRYIIVHKHWPWYNKNVK